MQGTHAAIQANAFHDRICYRILYALALALAVAIITQIRDTVRITALSRNA